MATSQGGEASDWPSAGSIGNGLSAVMDQWGCRVSDVPPDIFNTGANVDERVDRTSEAAAAVWPSVAALR